MELKPIKTEAEYQTALSEIEVLMSAADDTQEADRLDVLVMLVEKYEAKHYPIPLPDPIDFLLYVMDTRGLSRKDLEPFVGSRGRVAEVLNRVRPLSLAMIRHLSDGLNISVDLLVAGYDLRNAA